MRMKRPIRGSGKSGFTLIEIILALLVITIGVVAVTGLLGSTLDSSARSHSDLDVVSFADMVFNELHSRAGFDEIPTSGSFSIPDYAGGNSSLQIGSVAQFTCQVPGTGTPLHDSYTVSYQLDAVQEGNIIKSTLQVWPGYDATGQPRRFHTEIYNWNK